MRFSVTIALLLSAAATVVAVPFRRQSDPGTIVSPANGAVIAPGHAFDFQYNTRADYGISSYNYSVFLFTAEPADSFSPSDDYATGHFFGRFAEPNYPGNPYPPNPPPAQLIMPDFSKNPGGFGTGSSDSDGIFYLAVIEEYGTGQASVGLRMGLAISQILYNTTIPENN